MTLSRLLAALAAVLLLATPVAAQKSFEPQIGQPGKDVIWVPTPDEVVERMLMMAQTTSNDFVIDLGSGDGKIAIAAAKRFGARALGIEYNPDMVKLSQKNAEAAGIASKAAFRHGDIFAADFSEASVITMYLLPALNLKLRPQLLSMRPGTRIVSHSFHLDDWEADEISSMDGRRVYFWVVPANVIGSWAMEMHSGGSVRRHDLNFEQRFQKVDGSISLGSVLAGLRGARLRGTLISFAYVDQTGVQREVSGRVLGNRMEGSYRADNGDEGRWVALKR